MALTLILGAANTGKTGEVFRRAEASADEGRTPVLILPTSADVQWVRREFAGRRPLGVAVSRFDGHVRGLWPARGDGRRIVTPIQRDWLLRRCAADAGVVAGVAGTVARLVGRMAGAAGEAWRTEARPGFGPLGEVLWRYADSLRECGLVELGEAVGILVGAGSASLRGSDIFLHHFSDFTEAQERFVRDAPAAGANVVVSFTWVPDHPATQALTPLVGRLAASAEIVDMGQLDTTTTAPELRRIGEGLFRQLTQRPPEGGVRFSSAEGDEAEADRVVAEVQTLVRREGIVPERIAVVFREVGGRAGALDRAFAEAGIPVDIDAPVSLGATPYGRALFALLDFLEGGDREALLTWVRSGYAGSSDDALALERHWRARDVRDRERLTRGLRRLGSWQPALARSCGSAEPGKCAGIGTWAELIDRMFAVRWAGSMSATDAIETDAAARAAAVRVLSDLLDIGEAELSARDLRAGLRFATIAPSLFERPGHVQVMGAARVRGRRFDAVVLGGLNEGEFPRRGDDVHASEEAGRLLSACGASVASLPEAERMLLYETVTRARHRLVLSRRVTDSEGRPLGASVFWEELRDFFRPPGEAEKADAALSGLDRRSALGDVALDENASVGLRRALREAALSGRGEGLPGQGIQTRMDQAHARSARRGDRIEDPALRSEIGARETFTARELELYARCPRRWFAEHIMRPDGLDYRVDARARGLLAHDAVTRALERLFAEGRSRVTHDLEPRLPELAADATDAAIAASDVPAEQRAAVASWVRPRVLRSLRADTDALPGFAPVRLEWAVGHESGGAVSLGSFALSGRVDRVDQASDGRFVVVDYKSGSVDDCARTRWVSSSHLQVGLYALAVERSLGGSPVGCVYRSLANGRTRGAYDAERCPVETLVSTDAAEDFRGLLDWVRMRAEEAVAGIRSGDIAPVRGGQCEYCAASSYCDGGEAA